MMKSISTWKQELTKGAHAARSRHLCSSTAAAGCWVISQPMSV